MTEIYCQVFHVMPKCYERVNLLIWMIWLACLRWRLC